MPKTNNKAVQMAAAGGTYESWTVIGLPPKKRFDYVVCQCECGVEKEVNVYSLTSGKSKSCGCKALENRRVTKDGYAG